MILNDERLKAVGAANQGRYTMSLVTDLMDTIRDLKRQLAERDAETAAAVKREAAEQLGKRKVM